MRGSSLAKIISPFSVPSAFVTRMFHQVVVALFLIAGMTFVYVIAIRHTELHQERPPKAPRRDNTKIRS
jgi:hypothetical protein